MNQILDRLLSVGYGYSDFAELQYARRVITTCWLLIGFQITWFILLLSPFSFIAPDQSPTIWLVLAVSTALIIGVYILVQQGHLSFAARSLMVVALFEATLLILLDLVSGVHLVLLIPLITASVVGGSRGLVGSLVIICAVLYQHILSAGRIYDGVVTNEPLVDFVILTLFYTLLTGLLLIFNQNARQTAASLLAIKQHFTKLVELPSPLADESHPIDTIANSVRFLKDDLGYSFVQAYLYKADATIAYHIYSSLGNVQIVSNSNIVHDEDSPYHRAIQTGEPQITSREYQQWLAAESVTLRSSTIIPLVDDGQAIGVLEIQSSSTIDPHRIESLKQLAILLTRSYLLHMETLSAIEQIGVQQRNIDQLQAQLNDYKSDETDMDWLTAFQRPGQVRGYNLQTHSGQISRSDDLAGELGKVLNTPNYTLDIDEVSQENKLTIPIRLGDIVLGAFAVEMPDGNALNKNQIDLVLSVMQRLALAIQAQRLFQQSRSQAERERKVNEISRQFLSSTDIRSILQLAADNLNDALGATQTRIHLEPEFITRESQELPQVEEEPSQ